MGADFKLSHAKLEEKEGIGRQGYGDHPQDRGGETINGIARVHWPKAPIWQVVDELRAAPGFPGTLDTDPRIHALTLLFYRQNFWDAMGLDHCELQAVADELYEQAVNMGLLRAGENLQEALNFVNRKSVAGAVVLMWPDVKLDGAPGPVTMAAVSACYRAGRAAALYNWMNILQGEDLAVIMRRRPEQRVFAAGWGRRVEIKGSF